MLAQSPHAKVVRRSPRGEGGLPHSSSCQTIQFLDLSVIHPEEQPSWGCPERLAPNLKHPPTRL
jgi:hypothetical protein